ncbi:MAG: cbb3-type cytochrome oxidase maturation protein [Patiriisocius sp.]|jgi:cbb3-type cytochrome oxidase maturation protein
MEGGLWDVDEFSISDANAKHIFILVPVSVAIIFVVIVTLIWSVNHHQFDDLEKEAERIRDKGDSVLGHYLKYIILIALVPSIEWLLERPNSLVQELFWQIRER